MIPVTAAPTALSGGWDDALAAADGYRPARERSGAPAAPGRAIAPAALALICALREDDDAAAEWRATYTAMRGHPAETTAPPAYIRVFDAVLALDRGRPAEALATLGGAGREFYDLLFAPWHTALSAEAGVLASDACADELPHTAHTICAADSIPGVITRRAVGLRRKDCTGQTGPAFAALGAPYQDKRSKGLTHAD